MSELNAAASLALDINTDLAEGKLNALQARLASLGITGLQQSAGEAGVAITRLESQVNELKQALATANIANSGLTSQLKDQVEAYKKKLDAVKTSALSEQKVLNETTKNYMTHYEMVSRGAKATGSSIKSMMEAMTSPRPGMDAMSSYYAALEKVDRMASSQSSAAAAMAGRRQQEVRALTATNSELQRMGQFYAELERKGKSELTARNVAETTRNYMTHFEEVSRGARASASSIKSMADAMTTTRPGIEELNRYYAALEKVDKVTRSEMSAATAMAGRRQQEVRALTSTSVELQRLGEHYSKLERDGRVAITNGLVRPFEEASRAARATSNSIKSAVEAITYPHAQKSGISDYYRKQGAVEGGGQGLAAISAGVSEAELIQAQKTATAAAAVAQAKKQVVEPTRAVTKATKEATEAAGHWSKAAYQQHAFARGLAGSLGQLWMTYGTLAPLLAGAAIGAAAKSAVNMGKEFEYQLTFVKALGGESAEAVERLGAAAKNLAKDGMFGPTEIASGMRVLAQAGLNANEALLAIPHALDLATVGEMEMAAAATTLVGIMNAFSMSVSQIPDIGNIFAKAAAVSQVSVADMTQAMRMASVVGEQYGASIEDTATALTLLGKVNITGTAAGTSLRNMLKELYTPMDRAAKMMKTLGLETRTAEGTMRSFPDIIYDLRARLKEFDRASQVNVLQELFGERGAKEAIAMLSKTREEWEGLKSSISESDGFMRQVASELEATTKGSLTQAFNTLKVTMVEAFQSTDGAVGKLALSLKEAFGSTELKTTINLVAEALIDITSAVVTLGPVLATVAAGWAALKIAMIGAAAWAGLGTAIGTTVAALSGMAGALLATTGAMGPTMAGAVGLRGAFTALGASTSALAGPIGILAAGLMGAAVWFGRLATEASNTTLVTSTRDLADAFDSLANRTKASNDALVENMRLRGQSSTSAVGDAEYQLYQKEVSRNTLRQQVEATEAYARSARGMTLGDIARPENVPFRVGQLDVKKAEMANLEAEVERAKKGLERARFEDQRQKDLQDGLALESHIREQGERRELQTGARNLEVEDYLKGGRSTLEAMNDGIKEENARAEKIVASLKLNDASADKIQLALAARDNNIKKIREKYAEKGGRIDRSTIFEQKDIAKLADTEYKRAMSEIEYDKKLLDLKRNASLINEREYERGLDDLAQQSVSKAIVRELTKQKAIENALKDPSLPEPNRKDLQRQSVQSGADLGLLLEKAKQEQQFKLDRDQIRQDSQLASNVDALKDLAEQRRQAFEDRMAQFRIEREMDPVIAEGLRARLEASKAYADQERVILAQLALETDATSAHAAALRDQYDALLSAKEGAMQFSEAQAQMEERQRRSPMAGYENVLRQITDESGNLARVMEDGLGGSIDRASQSFVELATTGKTSMRSMVADILNHLAKLAAAEGFKMLIQFAMQAGMAYFSGGSSLVGPKTGTIQAAGVQSSGAITYPVRHTGGMADSSGASRLVDSSVFRDAPRYHTGGVLPGEVPIIAKKGEGVFTPEQMKALAPVDKMQKGGDTSVVNNNVTINVTEGGQRQETTNSNNSNSGKELARQIEGAVMNVLVREKRNGGILAN